MKKTAVLTVLGCVTLTGLFVHAQTPGITPLNNASMRPSSVTTNYVSYTSDNGSKTNFVLCLKGVNWTTSVRERGTPPIVSDLVGEVGIGLTKPEAAASAQPISLKKKDGQSVGYFKRQEPFNGVREFYLKLDYYNLGLTYETLVELKFVKEKK